MNKVEWLNSKVSNPVETKDYYFLYDDFCVEFQSEITMESFKRYCRDAYRSLKGELATDKSEIHSTVNKDGSLDVRLKSYDIKTEEDLRELSGLDSKIWECVKIDVKATQNNSNPYFIVWGKFEKKERELVYPLIQSVKVDVSGEIKEQADPTDTLVQFSDIHSPFHSEECLSIGLQVAKQVNPSIILLNGDLLDATDLSLKFLAPIEARNRMQEGLNRIGSFISVLREVFPKTKIIYLEGNHEIRLKSLILSNAAGAMGLKRVNDLDGFDALSIPNLLCLKELDVEWVPYDSEGYWITENLKAHHGEDLNLTRVTKANPYSLLMGHGHRNEIVSHTKDTFSGPIQNYTFMTGYMGDVNKGLPKTKKASNEWQQGFGVVHYNEEFSNPVPVYINNGKALYNGEIYTA